MAQDGGIFVEASPGLACTEVEHDEAGAAFVGGVDEVRDALSACPAYVCAEVEAEVVEVGVGVVDCGGEGVGCVDGVVVATVAVACDVHAHDFWAAGLRVRHAGVVVIVVDCGPPGVEEPEGFWALRKGRCDFEGLDVDEAGAVGAAEVDAVEGCVELVGWKVLDGACG